MEHHVYILYSLKDQKLYKGYTTNLPLRFNRHNSGGSPSTAQRRPFVLIYVESYKSAKDAKQREREIKTTKGIYKLKKKLRKWNILDDSNRLMNNG